MANVGKKTKENETKREKFVRLVENRMNNALKQIELLSNLSNTSAYEYTSADVEKMVKALKSAISELEKSFSISSNTSKKFKL